MKKNMSTFLLGFLAGAAAGAIAGILFAPDQGSQTRKNIKKKVRDLSEEYGLGIDELMDEMETQPESEPVIKPRAGRKAQTPKPRSAPKRKYTRKPKQSID